MRALALIFFFFAAPGWAAKVSRLAAPSWTVVNINPDLANFYANEVARTLKAQGLQVVTASDIATLLGNERQKQLLGCSEDSNACMAELGNALGVEGILTANLARLGDVYRGSLKVISAQDGTTVAEQPVDARSEASLLDALGDAAKKIGRTLNPPAPVDVRKWALVPLVGGVLFGVGSAASFGLASKKYGDIVDATSEDQALGVAKEGQGWQATGWVTAGLAVASFGTAALIFFASDRPAVTPSVVVTGDGAAVGLSGTF